MIFGQTDQRNLPPHIIKTKLVKNMDHVLSRFSGSLDRSKSQNKWTRSVYLYILNVSMLVVDCPKWKMWLEWVCKIRSRKSYNLDLHDSRYLDIWSDVDMLALIFLKLLANKNSQIGLNWEIWEIWINPDLGFWRISNWSMCYFLWILIRLHIHITADVQIS